MPEPIHPVAVAVGSSTDGGSIRRAIALAVGGAVLLFAPKLGIDLSDAQAQWFGAALVTYVASGNLAKAVLAFSRGKALAAAADAGQVAAAIITTPAQALAELGGGK